MIPILYCIQTSSNIVIHFCVKVLPDLTISLVISKNEINLSIYLNNVPSTIHSGKKRAKGQMKILFCFSFLLQIARYSLKRASHAGILMGPKFPTLFQLFLVRHLLITRSSGSCDFRVASDN